MKRSLADSTEQVFTDCSSVYLKEDKHWGCDIDIIREYLHKLKNVSLIELGTGYAWHLANLFLLSSIYFKKVIGVDYSEKMLSNARNYLDSIKYNGYILSEKIELKMANILSLPFNDNNFNFAICLNNTLGNITADVLDYSHKKRNDALKEINRILDINGFFIVSVYNADTITQNEKYGKVFEIDEGLSNIENNDFVIRFTETGNLYYSHWFKKEELLTLLHDADFKILEIELRRKRIIVVAQKK